MLKKLPDVFNKREDSNLAKLLNIISAEIDEARDTLELIEAWRDVDQAEGEVLDRIGYNVMQFRGEVNDDIYRILIKSKIARNQSTGAVNTIIDILAFTLDIDFDEVQIKEMFEDGEEPAAIRLIEVPLGRINEVGMSPASFARLVSTTVAAGVRLDTVDLTGTFEFADELEGDNFEAGFADDDQTQGGYLGDIYTPEVEPGFPL